VARVSASRYNQYIATKAILLEVGAADNTLEEAKRTADFIAQAQGEE